MGVTLVKEDDVRAEIAALSGDAVISDAAAATVASWFHSPAARDSELARLSSGMDVDAPALWARLGEIAPEFPEHAAELAALRAWVLARMPRVVLSTWEISAEDWQARTESEDECARPDPDGVETFPVADYQDDQGDWVYPGDDGYPTDPVGMLVDTNDGGVWLPGSAVDTARALITGTGIGFWWGSRGGDPFDWSPYWEQTSPEERGNVFASRYANPYTGEVEIKIAVLLGFSGAELDTIAGN